MPRPQTPPAKARLTGADKNHPERYRDRREPKLSGRAIGAPPKTLPPAAKEAWRLFADELGWLTHEDRGALEAASLARASMWEMTASGEYPKASFFGNYRTLLGSLGATPVDRTKVMAGKEAEPDDPFAAFVQ